MRYELDKARIFNLWLMPATFSTDILVAFFSRYKSVPQITVVEVVVWTGLMICVLGVFVFLFFNHLPIAKQTKLLVIGVGIVDKEIQITQGGTLFKMRFSEIKDVIEYSTSTRLPWSPIIKWEIISTSHQVTLSSLTISSGNFERHFWNKIRWEKDSLPTM